MKPEDKRLLSLEEKTAYDILKNNGLVRQGESSMEVAHNANYLGLIHAMEEYASQYKSEVERLKAENERLKKLKTQPNHHQ